MLIINKLQMRVSIKNIINKKQERTMTVQELIDKLMEVSDKAKEVIVFSNHDYDIYKIVSVKEYEEDVDIDVDLH